MSLLQKDKALSSTHHTTNSLSPNWLTNDCECRRTKETMKINNISMYNFAFHSVGSIFFYEFALARAVSKLENYLHLKMY